MRGLLPLDQPIKQRGCQAVPGQDERSLAYVIRQKDGLMRSRPWSGQGLAKNLPFQFWDGSDRKWEEMLRRSEIGRRFDKLPKGVNLRGEAADGAHAPPGPEGSRIRTEPVLGAIKAIVARRAEMRELLRLPVRVERPRDGSTPAC